MGRHPWSDRVTVEQCSPLRIADLAHAGVFQAEHGNWCSCRWEDVSGKQVRIAVFRLQRDGESSMALHFRQEATSSFPGPRSMVEETVRITTTRCHFGGQRVWFRCPRVTNGRPCGRRVAVLYLLPNGHNFGCRECFGLTYASSQMHDARLDRLLRLPIEDFRKVLYDDARKLGSLAFRIGRILRRRLAKKARYRNWRFDAKRRFRHQANRRPYDAPEGSN